MFNSTTVPHRQRGIATLAMSLVIISVAAVVTINTSKGILFEQKTSSNQYWATLAHEAAQASLEETLAWAQSMEIPDPMPTSCPSPVNPHVLACWSDDTTTWSSSSTDLALSDRISSGTLVVGFDTSVHLQRETLLLSQLNFVEIIAEATSTTDSTIKAQVRQTIYLPTISVNTEGSGAPSVPLLLQDCYGAGTGGPDFYTGPNNLVLATLGGEDLCDKEGNPTDNWDSHVKLHLCDESKPASCNTLSEKSPAAAGPPPTTRIDFPGSSVWDVLFPSTSKAQMEAISDLQEAQGLDQESHPKRTVYWVDENKELDDASVDKQLGSEAEPVILILSNDVCASACPKLNGGETIYGVVYLDTDGDSEKANGWGGGNVYGTVAVEGGMADLNSNTELYYNADVNSALDIPAGPPGLKTAARVPGSWRDFD